MAGEPDASPSLSPSEGDIAAPPAMDASAPGDGPRGGASLEGAVLDAPAAERFGGTRPGLADAGPGRPSVSDAEAPSVPIVSAVPADGARGVAPEVVLAIDFGRAMNTSTLPAALVSDDLSFDRALTEWIADDSVARISFRAPLAAASGSDPARGEALCYTYGITEAALDATGRATAAESITFCTARRISQRLVALSDPDLTGNFRSDGVNGDGSCARATDAVCVGDSGSAANADYRGFLTFDASPLSKALELLDAELRLRVLATSGTPLDDLGELIVESARFDGIGAEAFRRASFVSLGNARPAPGDASLLRVNVAPALRDSEARREQFRLRFSAPTDGDGSADHVTFRPGEVELQLEYFAP